MNITIQFTNVEPTQAIRDYTEEKLQTLEKFFENIQKMDVDIGAREQRHNKGKRYYAEVNVHIPGKVVRVAKDTEDLYKAIDKVKDHLKVELQKIKDKMRRQDRRTIRHQKEYRVEEV
tara:strand:- start:136 stop:489 length:354 start_codon:yes stop_codon:yes gene_type:complete